jgi:hypothetical protein
VNSSLEVVVIPVQRVTRWLCFSLKSLFSRAAFNDDDHRPDIMLIFSLNRLAPTVLGWDLVHQALSHLCPRVHSSAPSGHLFSHVQPTRPHFQPLPCFTCHHLWETKV